MAQITTVTCSGHNDGTKHFVHLEFMNSYDSNPRDTCVTDRLDKSGDEFAVGQTDVWAGEGLGSCTEDRFRPTGDLSFRFHTRVFLFSFDELRLCSVTAQFGRPGVAGYSVWQWTGDLYNAEYSLTAASGANSRSNWRTMRKIAG